VEVYTHALIFTKIDCVELIGVNSNFFLSLTNKECKRLLIYIDPHIDMFTMNYPPLTIGKNQKEMISFPFVHIKLTLNPTLNEGRDVTCGLT